MFWGICEKNALEQTPQGQMVGVIDQAIEVLRPTELYVPLPSCNQDHLAVWDACLTALRLGRAASVKRAYAYEYPMQNSPKILKYLYIPFYGIYGAFFYLNENIHHNLRHGDYR